jgi:hypothetical protein
MWPFCLGEPRGLQEVQGERALPEERGHAGGSLHVDPPPHPIIFPSYLYCPKNNKKILVCRSQQQVSNLKMSSYKACLCLQRAVVRENGCRRGEGEGSRGLQEEAAGT